MLERPNAALVAAVSARVYTVVADAASVRGSDGSALVEVDSPQMGETRKYRYSVSEEGAGKLERIDEMGVNPYVEACVRER